MSNSIKGYVRTVAASLTMASTVLSLAGFAAFPVAAYAVAPADFGLREGDVIRATGDLDLYIVNDMGYKRLFVNPAIFNLYGHLGWSKVKEVAPSTRDAFVTSGLFRVDGDAKVYGLDVVSEDVANLRWVNTTGAQAVADDANFFKKVFTINAAEKALYGMGADYTSVLQVPNYSRGTTVSTGPLSASLASDNPASGAIVSTAAAVDLAHFAVSGSGLVTKVVLKRVGLSADASLANVYLFVGNKRVSDSATVTTSTITFANSAGFFSAPATFSVRADMAGSSGETVGVQLTQLNDSVMSVSGNLHSIATASLAGVTVGSNTATSAPSSANAPGYTLWSASFNTTVRDAYLKHVAFKQVGSMPVDAIRNYNLYLDSVLVAAGTINADGSMVDFDMGSVGYLVKSNNHTLELRGDIVKGSNRTYSFAIQNKADVIITDSQYGANMPLGGTVPTTATSLTIPAGSVSVQTDSTFNTTNFVTGASSIPVARYILTGYGEDMKISQLVASISSPGHINLDNVSLWVNGSQVASAKNFVGAQLTFDLGSSLVVAAGSSTTVEVRLDSKTSGVNSVGTSVAATLMGVSNNAQGVSSGAVSTVPSTSGITGPTLTLVTGALTKALDTSVSSHVESPNQTKVKIGAIVIQAGNAEPIRVSNVQVALAVTGANINKYANLYISENTTPILPQATNNFSTNFTLAKNESRVITVYADAGNVASGSNSSTIQGTYTVTASGVDTGTSGLGFSSFAGQTITFSLATMATTTLSNDSMVGQYVLAGSTVTVAKYHMSMSAGAGTATVTDMHFTVTGSSSAGTISKITVAGKDATVISGVASVSGLAIAIPSGFSGVDVPVTVTYNTVGFGGVAKANDTSILTLDEIKYTSGNTVKTSPAVSQAARTMRLIASYPTLAIAAPADAKLVNGQVKIATFTVSAPLSGNITLHDLPLTFFTTGGATASSSGTTAGTSILVKDGNTTITTTTPAVFSVSTSSTGSETVSFTNGYTVTAGTTKVFDIYFSNIGGSLGNAGTSSFGTKLGSAATFTFDDVNGGNPGLLSTGTNIFTYPTNTATVSN